MPELVLYVSVLYVSVCIGFEGLFDGFLAYNLIIPVEENSLGTLIPSNVISPDEQSFY